MNYIKKLINTYIIPFRRILAGTLAGFVVAGGAICYNNYKNIGYVVSFDGKVLGYVRNQETAINIFDGVKKELASIDSSITVNGDLNFQKTRVINDKLTPTKSIEKDLKSDLYPKFTSYAIMVNGKEAAIVDTEEEAKQVIDGVKKYFADQESKNGYDVVEVKIKDDIQFSSKVVDVSKLMDVDTAIKTLVGSKGTTQKYQVKQGDTLWTIAKNNNAKMDDIIAANPGVNLEKLQLGQAINLTASVSNINVEVTLNTTYDENIAYDTQYTTDNSLYKGQTKVVNSGQYGTKRIVEKITKLNGVEIAKSILSTAIVKQPMPQLMARGTKDIVGSGQFIMPVNGHITSGYGYRSGGFHAGVDICAPQGTPIHAADGGTVIHAGWYYGYGNLVIISHGNGYTTYYGHCSAIYVKVGQSVSRGSVIAAVGHTGDAQGNHCHFEVRLNGSTQNPTRYIR